MSCAHQQSTSELKEANKYSYLQEFYKNRDKLKLETKSCKNYMKTRFQPLMTTSKKGKVSIKNLKDAAFEYYYYEHRSLVPSDLLGILVESIVIDSLCYN